MRLLLNRAGRRRIQQILVFYLGHLEAFDWHLLASHVYGLDSFHRQFDHLFAFGIDPVDGAAERSAERLARLR